MQPCHLSLDFELRLKGTTLTPSALQVVYARMRYQGKGGLGGTPSGAALGAAGAVPPASAGGYGNAPAAGGLKAELEKMFTGPEAGGDAGLSLDRVRAAMAIFLLAPQLRSAVAAAARAACRVWTATRRWPQVVSLLNNRFTKEAIKAEVIGMMNEGNIYTTIDEEHFKSTLV